MMGGKSLMLIRHGQSVANSGLPTSNPTTIPMTELGHLQAETTARSLSLVPTLIVSSPMKRALQTADPFRREFPDVPFEIWPVQEFVFLDLSGQPASTPQERRPIVSAYWARCNPGEVGANGTCESFEQLCARVISFHRRIMSHPAQTVAVISHGFFISAYIYGRDHDFPPCTSAVMAEIYKHSLAKNPTNAQAIMLSRD